jgi:5-methylphenazine-1-carboxylate 1-monooxygenase
MKVLIAGGGIGGLSCALSLHAAGIECTVLERAREIRPLGVGINLQPHAVRELIELGLGEELARTAVATAELVYLDHHGRLKYREPCGVGRGYRWPQYSVHRGRLQMLLLNAVRARSGDAAVRAGARVEDVRTDSSGVAVRVADEFAGTVRELTADLLVGADGLDSTVRSRLHPEQAPVHWSGTLMWRGAAEGEPFLTGRSMIHADDGRLVRFIAYPISGPGDRDGRVLINWVCQVTVAEPQPLAEGAGWNRPGRLQDVLPHLRGWRAEGLDIPGLVARSPQIMEYPMVDREPLAWWGTDNITLLGDAAHPMYPVGANGASQAVVDARVLAYELATDKTATTALRRYEARRRDATKDVVLAAREMDRAEREARASAAVRAERGNTMDRAYGEISTAYRRRAGNDVAELNARPSLTPPRLG